MSTGDESAGGQARSAADPVTPPTIPEHVLLRKIGKGSYGEIWLARSALGAYRAVKIIRRSTLREFVGAYEREFAGIERYEPLSRNHEGLVQLLQFGRGGSGDPEFFYYVMELADDAGRCSANVEEAAQRQRDSSFVERYAPRTLAHDIRLLAPLAFDEVLDLGVRLAEALHFLHSKRLVHRDLKPSNIIFVGGVPKLADVGCVAELDNSLSAAGTVGYMPSEGPSTASADIFSVGKILYEAASGKDRQDFPDLPTELLDRDNSGLAELNEIWVKACANNPAERYASADQLLEDLNQLRQGKSLRTARLRRRQLSLASGALAIVLAVGAIAVIARAIRPNTPPKPQVLFMDDFAGPRPDPKKWTWSTKGWPGLYDTGHRQFRMEQTNHELTIEAKAQHEGGWTTHGAAWLDTKLDLRKSGESRIEIELAGTNLLSISSLSISDGLAPADAEDSQAVRLLALPGKHDSLPRNEPWPLVHEQIRIDLLPSHQAAVVYPDARIPEQFEIVDLGRLPAWRLRFYAMANSSAVNSNGLAQFRIKRISITAQPTSKILVGHVIDSLTRRPIVGATIQDINGARLAMTHANGGFKLTADDWPLHLRVKHDDYFSSEATLISNAARQFGPVTVQLRKCSFVFGEVVEVIPYTNNISPTIGFWGTNLCVLANEGEGFAAESVLRPVDVQTKRLLSAVSRFPTGAHPLSFFAECGERIIATMPHPGGIYDLADGKHALILSPKTANERPIDWPIGCAFDGEFFWFVERDDITNWYGLHAVDLDSRKIKHSLPSTVNKLVGLAWDADNGQFWVSDLSEGVVFSLSRDKALREGKLENARGRAFNGNYICLAFKDGHLWGLDADRKQICKIKVKD